MRIYVVADDAGREAGFVGEQLESRGGKLNYLERSELPDFAVLNDPALLLLLGSHSAAHDPANAGIVAAESRLSLAALDAGVPVIAICYGAQLLARALGGNSYEGRAPELGWCRVETNDDVLCPPGPWAQLHRDAFDAPPTSAVLATSPYGAQAFIDESRNARAIAWQFHPEVTADRYIGWVDEDAAFYESHGADLEAIRIQTRERESVSRTAAHKLTDSALAYLFRERRP